MKRNNFKIKISVITVNLNNAKGLQDTIKSVINQKGVEIEYVIIDGGSTDGSLEVIKKFENNIAFWESKKDLGIYYAMNRGLECIKGTWINFMNSGDIFYNDHIVKDVFNKVKDADIIYGDNVLHYNWGNIVLAPDCIENMTKYMVFGHQTVFVKSSILNNYKFDTRYSISADYCLFYKLYLEKYKHKYLPFCISVCDCTNGVSKEKPLITFKENAMINGQINQLYWPIKYNIYRSIIFIRIFAKKLFTKRYIENRNKRNILKSKLIKNVIAEYKNINI